jgi:uncharacterized ubiquitin-like protein YukD
MKRLTINKWKPYFFPIIFLILISILTWVIFFSFNIVSDNDKRITGIISILGLSFGIFQFWINELNIDRRKKFDLRYNTYKEIENLIELLTETINNRMIDSEKENIHSFLSSIMNQINRILSILNINDRYLFPEIFKQSEAIELKALLEKILNSTNSYRINVEKELREKSPDMREYYKYIESVNWHNDLRELLIDLHSSKLKFYKTLRGYL